MSDKIHNGEFACPACNKNISIFDVYEADTMICEFKHGGADCNVCKNENGSQFKYDGSVEHTHEVQVSENQKQLKVFSFKEIEDIADCIRNARVELEQGGKYHWNSDLQSCDNWLKLALKRCEELKIK